MKFLSTTNLIIACFAVLAMFFVAMTTIGTRRFRIKDYRKFRFLFGAMVVVALDLALVAILDISSTPYSGYEVSPGYSVIHIDPSGPAAIAGALIVGAVFGEAVAVAHDDTSGQSGGENRPTCSIAIA